MIQTSVFRSTFDTPILYTKQTLENLTDRVLQESQKSEIQKWIHRIHKHIW